MLSENDSVYDQPRGSYSKYKISDDRVAWLELDSTLEDYNCSPEKDDYRKSMSINHLTIQEDESSEEICSCIEESLRSELDFYEEELEENVSQEISYPYITSLSCNRELSAIYSFSRVYVNLDSMKGAGQIKDVINSVFRADLRWGFDEMKLNCKLEKEKNKISSLHLQLRKQSVKIISFSFIRRLKSVIDIWKTAPSRYCSEQNQDLLKKIMIERLILKCTVRNEESAFLKWCLLNKPTKLDVNIQALYSKTRNLLKDRAQSRKESLHNKISNLLGPNNRPEMLKAYVAYHMILLGRSNLEQRAIWKWRVVTKISSVLGTQVSRINSQQQKTRKNLIYLSCV